MKYNDLHKHMFVTYICWEIIRGDIAREVSVCVAHICFEFLQFFFFLWFQLISF